MQWRNAWNSGWNPNFLTSWCKINKRAWGLVRIKMDCGVPHELVYDSGHVIWHIQQLSANIWFPSLKKKLLRCVNIGWYLCLVAYVGNIWLAFKMGFLAPASVVFQHVWWTREMGFLNNVRPVEVHFLEWAGVYSSINFLQNLDFQSYPWMDCFMPTLSSFVAAFTNWRRDFTRSILETIAVVKFGFQFIICDRTCLELFFLDEVSIDGFGRIFLQLRLETCGRV